MLYFADKQIVCFFLRKKPTLFDLECLKQILDRKAERKDDVVISGKVLLFKDIKISLGLLMTALEIHPPFRENHHLKVSTTSYNRISASVLSNPTFQANRSASASY